MTTRVWLIRHGEPADEVRGRCYGSLDIELSEKGRGQMERVANFLRSEPIQAIYTSPLRRASESAQIIGSLLNCSCERVAALREIHFGALEGLTFDEIAATYPDLYRQWAVAPAEIQFPNGESFPEVRVRAVDAIQEILRRNSGQTVAIVAHGGVIRVLVAWALGMPDICLFRLAQGYGAINLIAWTGGPPTLQLLNHHPD